MAALALEPEIAAPAQPTLDKPIAIPSTTSILGSPFLRAYPTALQSFDILPKQFLEFLDSLNVVMVKSPPLQVLGLAGTVVSFCALSQHRSLVDR